MSSKMHQRIVHLKSALEKVQVLDEALIQDILVRVVIATIDKYQQKLNVGVQDSVADLLDQFKRKMELEIFDIASKWNLNIEPQKFLFPKNCRFASSIGRSTIVVIENEPIRRTLTLDTGLLGEEERVRTNATERHNLLLPYMLFFFHFKKDEGIIGSHRFVNAYTAWRKSPIVKLNDPIYNPILPNTHLNYNICLGNSLPTFTGSIAQICDSVQNYYWQSVFNTDLGKFWWDKQSIPSMRDVKTWSESSKNEFMYNEVQLHSGGKTVESMINFCIQASAPEGDNNLRHRLATLIEGCIEEFSQRVMRYFKNTKFEKLYPKEIIDPLQNSLTSMTDELSTLAAVMQDELESIARETNSHMGRGFGWEQRAPSWKPYS